MDPLIRDAVDLLSRGGPTAILAGVLVFFAIALFRGWLYPRSTVDAMKAQMADLILQREAQAAVARGSTEAFKAALDLIERLGSPRGKLR